MYMITTIMGLAFVLSGCMVITVPAESPPSVTDIQIQLVQPFNWTLDNNTPVTVTTTPQLTTAPTCTIPPLPFGSIAPLLNISKDGPALTPPQIDELMMNYIDDLHSHIERYQQNIVEYHESLQQRCGGDTQ